MAPLHLFIPSIMACLVLPLTTTAQSGGIKPVTSSTTIPSLDKLLAAIPAISNTSNIEIEVPSITIAAEKPPTSVPGDDTYVLIGCFNENRPPFLQLEHWKQQIVT
jgi:hypothetical protein